MSQSPSGSAVTAAGAATPSKLNVIASGDWQRNTLMRDYRAEWFSDMLVERATWGIDAPVQKIGQLVIAAPSYVWCRFWSSEANRVVEKYFDPQGNTLGYYVRVGMTLPHHGRGFSMLDMLLGIWITDDSRVTIHSEERFDRAVRTGEMSPVEAEHAELIIRELTTSIAQKRFPAPFVRNFALATKSS